MMLAMSPIEWSIAAVLLPVNKIRKISRFLSAWSLLLTAMILFLSAAGASPSLHKLIHADSHAADHNCAITLFAKGHFASTPLAPITAAFVIQSVESRPMVDLVGHPVFDVSLAPGRAPPAC
jgi:hypothetical protein